MRRYDVSQLTFEPGTVFKLTTPADPDHDMLFVSHGFVGSVP